MGEWSIRGANDAIDFVNEEKDLQLSFGRHSKNVLIVSAKTVDASLSVV